MTPAPQPTSASQPALAPNGGATFGSAAVAALVLALLLSTPATAGLGSLLSRGKHDAQMRQQWGASPVPAAPAPVADGAIFHAAQGYAPLTSGSRAAMVGDVLTIVLAEKTQATKSNSANTDRNGSISVTPPPTGPLSFLKKTDIGMGAGGTFTGKGGAEQSNQLSGAISVTVAAIYPNGTMLVRGQKVLNLNRGDEQIRISGIVRVADIAYDNSVLSSRVADAQITYSGSGEIARASQQGWLGRFFSRVSPF